MRNFSKYYRVEYVSRLLASFLLLSCTLLVSAQPAPAQMQPNKRAEKLSKDAYSEFYNGNFKKAIEYCDKAIKAQPQFAYAYYIKGWSQLGLRMYQQALFSLNKSLEQGQDPVDVSEPRGQVYYFLKDYPNAEKDLLQFTASPKNNGSANFMLAQTFFEQQKYQAALQRYQRALEMGFQNKDIQYFIAVCQGALQDRAAQEKAAMQAVQIESQFKADAYYQLGTAFFHQKKYDEAIAAYDRALQLKPAIKDAYFYLYRSYRLLNRVDDAVAIMKRRIKEDPNDLQAYLNLSWISSLSDRPQEAVEAARQATKIKPEEGTGFTNMCRAYNDLKLYDSAVQACNDALRIKPGDGETFLYLARAKEAQKKSTEATVFFARAVTGMVEYTRQNPDNADGFYLLGNAYYATEQRSKAVTAYLKALELSPRYVKARFNLGYIYAQLGDHKSAKDQYDMLMVLDSTLAAKLLPNIEKPGK